MTDFAHRQRIMQTVERMYDAAQDAFSVVMKAGGKPTAALLDQLTVCHEAMSSRSPSGQRYFDILCDIEEMITKAAAKSDIP